MKYVLCLLLALVVGGKSFAKGNGDLNLKNFPEGYVPKEIGAKLGRHFTYRANTFCMMANGFIMPKFVRGWGLCAMPR